MNLYDLRERRVVWSASTSGIATKNMIGSLIFLGAVGVVLVAGDEPADLKTVREAVIRAMDSVPSVPGFHGGTVSPIDKS